MADPLPPRPAADRHRRPPTAPTGLAALALLGAGALLSGCAATAHPSGSGSPGPQVRRVAAPAPGPTPAQVPAQVPAAARPTPVRVLAVAYSSATPAPPAPPGRATAWLRTGAAARRPDPAPGRPAAPAAPAAPPPRRAPAPAEAQRGVPPRQPGVCELGRHYGGWPAGSPQEAACQAVYG